MSYYEHLLKSAEENAINLIDDDISKIEAYNKELIDFIRKQQLQFSSIPNMFEVDKIKQTISETSKDYKDTCYNEIFDRFKKTQLTPTKRIKYPIRENLLKVDQFSSRKSNHKNSN